MWCLGGVSNLKILHSLIICKNLLDKKHVLTAFEKVGFKRKRFIFYYSTTIPADKEKPPFYKMPQVW